MTAEIAAVTAKELARFNSPAKAMQKVIMSGRDAFGANVLLPSKLAIAEGLCELATFKEPPWRSQFRNFPDPVEGNIGNILDACARFVLNPPPEQVEIHELATPLGFMQSGIRDLHGHENIILSSLQAIAEAAAQSQDPQAIENLQNFYKQFIFVMAKAGMKPPIVENKEVTLVDIRRARLTSSRRNSMEALPTSDKNYVPTRTSTGAEYLHQKLSDKVEIHIVNKPVLATPEARLDSEKTGITAEFALAGQKIGYRTQLVTFDSETNTWKAAHLAQPLISENFDPLRNTMSQQAGIWTDELSAEETRFAVLIDVDLPEAPLVYEEEIEYSQHNILHLIDAETATAVVNLLNSTEQIEKIGITNNLVFTDKGAQMLLDTLPANILDNKIRCLREATQKQTFYTISFSVRVATADGSSRDVPLKIDILHSPQLHTSAAVETFMTPGHSSTFIENIDEDSPSAQDQRQILLDLGYTSESDTLLVINSHLERTRSTGSDTASKQDASSRERIVNELILTPEVTNFDTEAAGWRGNEISVVPIISAQTYSQTLNTQPEMTLRQILTEQLEKKAKGATYYWDSPLLLTKHKELSKPKVIWTLDSPLVFSSSDQTDQAMVIATGEDKPDTTTTIGTVQVVGIIAPTRLRVIGKKSE